VNVFQVDLLEDLAARIEAWDDTWQATYNEEDPTAARFRSNEMHAA